MNEYISPKGHTWDEVEKELFTPEEIAASSLRVGLMVELTRARNECGISQKSSKKLAGLNSRL